MISTLFLGSTIDSSTILTFLVVMKRSAHLGVGFVLLINLFENNFPARTSRLTVSSVKTCLLEIRKSFNVIDLLNNYAFVT